MPDLVNDWRVQITPRETLEWEREDRQIKESYEHEVAVARLNVDAKRQLTIMQHENALKSQQHSEKMKELELEIRKLDVQWGSWLRIPVLIVKLPVLILFSVAYIVSVATGHEINSNEFWRFIK